MFPETLKSKMGYSNKRKRSKRQRTRILNAIHNHANVNNNLSLPTDDTSLDSLEPSSSYISFCSTPSSNSYTGNDTAMIPGNDTAMIPPNTIILDNVGTSTDNLNRNNSSALDIDPEDQILNPGAEEDQSSNQVDDITTQSTSSSSVNNQVGHHPSYSYHKGWEQMTRDEIASYKIMSLLDSAGAPRICYNRLVALLKKLSKHDDFDVNKAINRETLMRRLERKHKTPPRIHSSTINKQEVFRFSFHDMLQDLIHSSCKHLHQILPNGEGHIPEKGTEHELWSTPWMNKTFSMQEYCDFNPQTDIMLPVIVYMDKTGIDVNQRYSMEPVLFSVGAIPREHRESRHSWRHLGFVPQKQRCPEEETTSDLQFFHDCLYYLLDGLREAQKNPPTVLVKLKGEDRIVERKAYLPLIIVMGDQLSQDTLCGRLKSNSGGAGRVHRSCMCSYLNIDDPYHQCQKVNITSLNLLSSYAMTSDEHISRQVESDGTVLASAKDSRTLKTFLHKQRAMFRSILRHPFTLHPIKNAFEGINFGGWSGGIHEATFDDFMHSVEAGMISYITQAVYDGLTKKENETVEELTRGMLDKHRCSVVSNYPRWRLQPGFTRQTLMTSGERVGSLLALSLSLQEPTVRETIRSGHYRQIQKYNDLSMEPSAQHEEPPPELYLNQHMHTLEDQRIQHTLEHMLRHGFPLHLIHDLDPYQINQMVWHCSEIFKTTQYPESYLTRHVKDIYTDMGPLHQIPPESYLLVKYALQTKPSKLIKPHRHRTVDGATAKHLRKKVSKKGDGSTAAVLTSNMGTLSIFLEYVLCYHAFCKYSFTLPVFLQKSHDNIQNGNRFVVEYFQKLIYRGNNTVDSRFPKFHSQCRMGMHIADMNSVMHFCCETGERLLKTEAKGISRTAQQRGDETFLTQTMSRLQDRFVLDSVALHLEGKDKIRSPPPLEDQTDCFGRSHPHFIYDTETEDVWALNQKKERKEPDQQSGTLSQEVRQALKKLEPNMNRFRIYNEVILRDNSRLRASPNYTNAGPWYDYVNVSWEKWASGGIETYLLPAKCLCFFEKESQQSGIMEIFALIHSVDQASTGKVKGRTGSTLLTRHYNMEYDNKGRPVSHVVPVASIDSAIRCIPHASGDRLFHSEIPGITYILPRNHWAYTWLAVNDVLMNTNMQDISRGKKGKLNSLCGNQWLENVRKRYVIYLGAKSTEDLGGDSMDN